MTPLEMLAKGLDLLLVGRQYVDENDFTKALPVLIDAYELIYEAGSKTYQLQYNLLGSIEDVRYALEGNSDSIK